MKSNKEDDKKLLREKCWRKWGREAKRYPELIEEYRYQIICSSGKVLNADSPGKLFEMYLEEETGIVERWFRDRETQTNE